VVGRKDAQSVYYAVADPALFHLLDDARQIFNNQLVDMQDLLAQISKSRPKRPAR